MSYPFPPQFIVPPTLPKQQAKISHCERDLYEPSYCRMWGDSSFSLKCGRTGGYSSWTYLISKRVCSTRCFFFAHLAAFDATTPPPRNSGDDPEQFHLLLILSDLACCDV